MLNVVMLSKPRFIEDLEDIIRYYNTVFNARVIAFCNFENTFKSTDNIIIRTVAPYNGFHRQALLYEDFMNSNDILNDGDYVLFVDDDEYLYSPSDIKLEDMFKIYNRDMYVFTEVMMSSKELLDTRDSSQRLYNILTYKQTRKDSQLKSAIRYHKDYIYDFHTKLKEDHLPLHTPLINNEFKASMLYFDVDGRLNCYDGLTSSYAMIPTDSLSPKIYHYHIKSKEDWEFKIMRGSAASRTPWYDSDITKNIFYDGYDKEDLMFRQFMQERSSSRFQGPQYH